MKIDNLEPVPCSKCLCSFISLLILPFISEINLFDGLCPDLQIYIAFQLIKRL